MGDGDVDGEHMWRLEEVVLGDADESGTTYRCELCPAVLVVAAGQTPPATA